MLPTIPVPSFPGASRTPTTVLAIVVGLANNAMMLEAVEVAAPDEFVATLIVTLLPVAETASGVLRPLTTNVTETVVLRADFDVKIRSLFAPSNAVVRAFDPRPQKTKLPVMLGAGRQKLSRGVPWLSLVTIGVVALNTRPSFVLTDALTNVDRTLTPGATTFNPAPRCEKLATVCVESTAPTETTLG